MVTFFVVEDEDTIRKGLCSFLRMLPGIEVLGSACDGLAALPEVRRLWPDALLTDILMPRMDGITMANSLRDDHWEGEIIFLSAYQDIGYLQNAIRVSSADYLFKPIENNELKSTVLRVATLVEKKRRHTPPLTPEQQAAGRDAALCGRIQQWIGDHLASADAQSLANEFSFSRSALYREFSRLFGMPINAYVTKMRMQRAYELLRDTNLMVYEIAERVGYRDVTYFSRVFKVNCGFYPGDFHRKTARKAIDKEET